MKKRTIYISLFLIFIIGVISLIGTFAIDTTITEGNSTKADYLFNITLGDRTNREIVIPGYDSKIVDIKISNPNDFNMSYLLYLAGVNSNISVINISDTDASGVLNSKTTNLIKVFIQNNDDTDITFSIKDVVGFERESLSAPSNGTAISKGPYYKSIVKSNNKDYGKVKPNIKLSTKSGTVKYTLVPNTGYQYKSNTCNGTVVDNILTISNITSNISCEVVFEPINVQVSFDLAGGLFGTSTIYTEPKEYTYTVPNTGDYKLETWGAQGGSNASYTGGYGGYASGNISLTKGQILYLNVGGTSSDTTGGYNGGGTALTGGTGGGGATHIATKSGLLSSLSSDLSSIVMVSGGGGGKGNTGAGGHAGGVSGNKGTDGSCTNKAGGGATQTAGGTCVESAWCNAGSFGLGGSGKAGNNGGAGGGGLYGGGSGTGGSCYGGGGGGSGYIGNSLLTDKYMYCYNCTTSDVESTKTYTTTNVSDTPTSDYAKSGNGAVKITIMYDVTLDIAYNDKYGDLPIPSKDGYTFEGWYTEPDGEGTLITDSSKVLNTKNHTLYAYWAQPTEYTTSGSYTYTVPRTGLYKLETWGAQGGTVVYSSTTYRGGYGGYSTGMVSLKKGDILYLNVGGAGSSAASTSTVAGGYNGGGAIASTNTTTDHYHASGGGATHIATKEGLLSTLSSDINSILIVSGGGGGGYRHTAGTGYSSIGGEGGGYLGTNSTLGDSNGKQGLGGSQTEGGKYTGSTESTSTMFGNFGQGGTTNKSWGSAGGGGFYGGGASFANISANGNSGGGGGSGYIGNSLLTDKYMYCYNCTTSDVESTKTYTTTNVSDTPTSDYAKGGDGAIKITFMGTDTEPPTGTMTTSKDYSTINASIDATDNFGIDHYEYYLSTSSTCPATGYTTSSSNTHSFVVKKAGTYHVCAKVVDGDNNILSLKSNAIEITKIYSVAVRYNVNGGTISSSAGGYTWTTDSTGLIYRNGSIYEQTIYYGEPADLADYNNSNFINIDPGDLHVPEGGEWICLSGCSTTDKVFNQATKYNVVDFCDVTSANCTVVVGLRLVSDTTKPTCTLSANESTITATASDDKGIAYQGWSSSYSGDNSTSKDIAAGDYVFYVKDIAGNTNTCSISVKSTFPYQKEVQTETSAYEEWSATGSCHCRGKSTEGGYPVQPGTCTLSGCSCPSGTSVYSNSCSKQHTGYYCTSGTLSGSKCIHKSYETRYACDSGYTQINNSWCYK